MKKNEERKKIQKLKEWRGIENIIPTIEDTLKMKIKRDKEEDRNLYERESPDFYFSNGKRSIGVEVTECHPSVLANKRTNAPVRLSFEEKVCNRFLENTFLHSITEKDKLIVIIKSGKYLSLASSIEEVCNSIEQHLRCWKDDTKYENINLVRGISVIKTKGKNKVYFSQAAPRNPVKSDNVLLRIKDKVNKLTNYQHNEESKCDEYWLCIFLPFEENKQSNEIEFDNKEKEFDDYIKNCSYDRICLTSEMSQDLNWLK